MKTTKQSDPLRGWVEPGGIYRCCDACGRIGWDHDSDTERATVDVTDRA